MHVMLVWISSNGQYCILHVTSYCLIVCVYIFWLEYIGTLCAYTHHACSTWIYRQVIYALTTYTKECSMLCTYHVCIYIYISYMLAYAGLRYISNSQLLWQWKPINEHGCFIYMYILSICEVYLPWWVLNINLRSCSQSCQLESSLESEESWIRLNFMARFCVDAVRTARKSFVFRKLFGRFDFDNLIIDPSEVVAVAILRSVLPINRWCFRLMILIC